MTTPQITLATFENGLLRPDESLNLAPHARVKLTVEPMEPFRRPTAEELDEFERYCDENAIVSHEPYLSREQLYDRR